MKVKIQQRSIYHKFAELEIEIPDNVKDIQDYLLNNENKWVENIDHKINEAEFTYGFGTDSYANSQYNSFMNEPEEESEWIYKTDDESGHL
jgi:hypothetical protein